MNLLSKIIAIAAVAVATIVTAPVAKAQDARVYSLLGGGTNKIVGLGTNSAIYLAVADFNEVAFQATVTAPAGASNIIYQVYRSVDSSDYETTPWTNLVAASASTGNTTVFNLSVGSFGSLKIVPANTNSGSYLTNLTLKARFKAAKVNDI